MRRQGWIADWHDRQIMPGAEWAQEIDAHLETASIILLLISADFLASDYCYDIEMQRALQRHKHREARVIPIILRPCDWHSAPFGHLQCLPRDGKAVITWQDKDEAFLTIAQELRRVIERQQIPARPLSRVQQQNRTRLLKRVRATWIEGVLEHSLHQAALIALDLQEQPDALANPWQLEVQETNVPPHLLPAGTPLVQIYDEAEGELLILGEPGAGKTTLLLHLASDLLKRAEQESTFPMPVIFTLSSWAEKRLSLADWLIEELFLKYQVPRHVGHSWIKDDQLLLLLDGLDEVTQVHRSACLQAINAYRQEHNLVPVVLCSRKAEYEAQSTRVALSKAVVIQPLTSQQIDDYLTQAGQQLEAVRSLLRTDQELQELARTPLMLTILALTYQGKAVDDLVTSMPADAQRHQVLAAYVERMLQRRAVSRYPPEQTKCWLAWLARQMAQHGQAEFYLERMQPSWLEEHQSLRHSYRAVVRIGTGLLGGLRYGLLVGGLLSGLLSGLFSGLLVGLTHRIEKEIKPAEVVIWSWKSMWQKLAKMESLRSALVGGLLSGLLVGLIFGLLVGLVSRTVSELLESAQDKQSLPLPSQERRYSVRNRVLVGLVGGLLSGLLVGLDAGLVFGLLVGLRYGLLVGLRYGLLGGLLGGLLVGLTHRVRKEVKPGEIISWLRASVWRELMKSESLKYMLVFGLLSVLIFGLLGGLVFGLLGGLVFGPISGLVFEFISGLIGGLSSDLLDKQILTKPNQGIQRSARNSILVGLIGGLVSGLLVGLLSGLRFGLLVGLLFGLLFGQISGLSIGLSNGGAASIQHAVLRAFLWRAGYTLWNYSRFLDYAAERILLRKVGGGYIFIHRLLLDYFASLEKKEP